MKQKPWKIRESPRKPWKVLNFFFCGNPEKVFTAFKSKFF